MLELFHPAVRSWFENRFPAGPTAPQAGAWREIGADRHTLIAAPTGSGKTLAAFLVCIDRIYRAHQADAERAEGPQELAEGPQVVYVSPLKALAADIWQDLERPLAEIAEVAAGMGVAAPDIRVAVRTGDTAASERAADPLNLTGIILPGPRVPATHTNTVSYTDGAVNCPPAAVAQ